MQGWFVFCLLSSLFDSLSAFLYISVVKGYALSIVVHVVFHF